MGDKRMFKRKAIREYVYDKVYDTSVAKKVITYIEIKSKYCKCEIYSLYKGEKEWEPFKQVPTSKITFLFQFYPCNACK